MNFRIMIGAIIIGYLGTSTIGNLLNLPDFGAVLAIGFIGGHLAHLMSKNSNK